MESGRSRSVGKGGQIQLWCRSQTSNPPVIIIWKENSVPIPSEYITVTSTAGDFFGTQVHSQVVLPAKKSRNGNIVTCLYEFDLALVVDQSQQFVINITGNYILSLLMAFLCPWLCLVMSMVKYHGYVHGYVHGYAHGYVWLCPLGLPVHTQKGFT